MAICIHYSVDYARCQLRSTVGAVHGTPQRRCAEQNLGFPESLVGLLHVATEQLLQLGRFHGRIPSRSTFSTRGLAPMAPCSRSSRGTTTVEITRSLSNPTSCARGSAARCPWSWRSPMYNVQRTVAGPRAPVRCGFDVPARPHHPNQEIWHPTETLSPSARQPSLHPAFSPGPPPTVTPSHSRRGTGWRRGCGYGASAHQ